MAKTTNKMRARSGKKTAARKGAKRATTKRATAVKARARGAVSRQSSARTTPRSGAAAQRTDPLRALADRIVAVTVEPDEVAMLDLYHDDIESTEAGQAPTVGIEALKQKLEMWRGMTTSSAFRPRNVATAGNAIVVEWEGTVTLAANGKTVTMNEVAVHEIENGKIVRERYYYDPTQLAPG
jgi:ketosteroid isomerase-like protein